MVFAIFFITLIFHPIDIDLQKKLYDKKNKYSITKIYKNAQLLLLIIVVISIIGVHCFKANNLPINPKAIGAIFVKNPIMLPT